MFKIRENIGVTLYPTNPITLQKKQQIGLSLKQQG